MRSTLLLIAVLAFTIYGQLMMKARALVHAAEFAGGRGGMHYLARMFTDVGVLSALAAAALAAICWMLAIARLDIAFAYPFHGPELHARADRIETAVRRGIARHATRSTGAHRGGRHAERAGAMTLAGQ